jgi:hypothetical protein
MTIRRRKYTPEQEKRMTEIHAEIAANNKRYAELAAEQKKLSEATRSLFLDLAFIGRGQI